MLAVIDTNVLLSALHSRGGPPAQVLDGWRSGRFQLATSAEQIEEFRRAASYPRLRPYLPRRAIGRMVNQLRKAEVMLSDQALLGLKRVAVTRIVSPRSFAAILSR